MNHEDRLEFQKPNEYERYRYLLNDGRKHRLAIIIPGGGFYIVADYLEGKPIAQKMNENGISAVTVRYRVREKAAFPAPLDDVAAAIDEALRRAEEWNLDVGGDAGTADLTGADGTARGDAGTESLMDENGFIRGDVLARRRGKDGNLCGNGDPGDYMLIGFSAGAYLAAAMGTEELGYKKYGFRKPGAITLCYPVLSMKSGVTHEGSRQMLFGQNPDEEMMKHCSLESLVTPSYPPTFLWCGTEDTDVPQENTKRFDRALTAAGVSHVTKFYPDTKHGVGLGAGTGAAGWFEEALSFMQKALDT